MYISQTKIIVFKQKETEALKFEQSNYGSNSFLLLLQTGLSTVMDNG